MIVYYLGCCRIERKNKCVNIGEKIAGVADFGGGNTVGLLYHITFNCSRNE